MKKMFTLTAVSAALTLMLTASAFASCPLKMNGTMTGAACNITPLPMVQHEVVNSYHYVPTMHRTAPATPCCNKKKGFFQKLWTPVTGVYDATFGQILNGLY